ncbi:excisionase family DNA binding protein [Xanthobacter sp. SG618]|uniref:helix-turn-helix transcriptional regulator n=1 Tax=Xanthobacter sp. SG618 TaxID=2587121 RepID=UPI00145D4C6F|nr:helix-turn-helix domain-containing protein [Xanthobacter sp. SG618]NMN57836.1 excisionase family DNA binding protein [Xanthobacter sp. SG618]
MTPEKRLISIPEVQNILKVSRGTIYRLMGAGKLTGRKIGKSVRFDISEIHGLIDNLPPAKIAPHT